MAPPTTTANKATFLPPGAAVFLIRRSAELGGGVLILVALALGLALASYHVLDPSLNTATAGPVRNLLGAPGAYLADLMIQSIGLAAWLTGAILAVWGWRLISHRGLGTPWLRIAMMPVTIVLSAIALAYLPVPSAWPVFAGLGGFTGTLALGAIGSVTAPWGMDILYVAATSTLLAIAAMVVALALPAREWRKLARAAVWLVRMAAKGGAAAAGLAWRACRWLFRGLFHLARGRGDTEARLEPHFDGPVHPEVLGKARAEPRLARPTESNGFVAPKAGSAIPGKRAQAARQKSLDLGETDDRMTPPLDLLDASQVEAAAGALNEDALAANARLLESVLEDFGVRGEIVKVRPGPVVALYELSPAPGTKSARVIGLADDIARSMSATSVRVAVIPGRNVIGIELPNASREPVSLKDLFASEAFERTPGQLTLVLGKDIGGTPFMVDLARMPHLLIAGTTGSGKSVAINTMILSALYRLTPEQCKLIMIDPKMLELSVYDGIPHLMTPVVTDPHKAVVALRWAVREMEERYRAMSNLGVRNIQGYNARIAEANRKGETLMRTIQTGFDSESGAPVYEDHPLAMEPLPFIIIVVDEMADLMLVAGKDVEGAVQRLSQMARAAGVHLIMATQRPSVDVITGTIKANFPTRISFQVTSKIDSRTILGEAGAEQLLGQGDMLYMAGGGRITRVHGPLVTDDEVERVVAFLKLQGEPSYVDEVTEDESGPGLFIDGGTEDELYDQAVALVCREQKASTSFVQRHLQIGYNRAARIIERMESEGVISPANHVGRREVLARHVGDRDS